MATTVGEIISAFPDLLKFVSGDKSIKIKLACSFNVMKNQGIVYVRDKKSLLKAIDSSISAIVFEEKLQANLGEQVTEKVLIQSPNTLLAMARVNKKFFADFSHLRPFDGQEIHPSAVISESAQIGEGTVIAPNAVIGASCVIGENCFIGPNSSIEFGTNIGSGSLIHANVFIGRGSILGRRCEIKANAAIGGDGFGYAPNENGRQERIPHLGKLILGDEVHIGSNTSIDRGTYEDTIFGDGTKIDNHCHIGHNNEFGKDCIVVAGLISAGSVKVGDNCIIGGRVCINGHLEVTDNVSLAPLAGVSSTVKTPGVYGGYPLQDIKESLRVQTSLSSLPRLRRIVAKMAKKMGIEE